MHAGHLPFEGKDKADVKAAITAGRLRALPHHLSPECCDFVNSMLEPQPSKRPGAAQLLAHPYVLRRCFSVLPAIAALTPQALQQPASLAATCQLKLTTCVQPVSHSLAQGLLTCCAELRQTGQAPLQPVCKWQETDPQACCAAWASTSQRSPSQGRHRVHCPRAATPSAAPWTATGARRPSSPSRHACTLASHLQLARPGCIETLASWVTVLLHPLDVCIASQGLSCAARD